MAPASINANLFQSTPPVRGATGKYFAICETMIISIHAPCAGGDWKLGGKKLAMGISIHAPCAGGDAGIRVTA